MMDLSMKGNGGMKSIMDKEKKNGQMDLVIKDSIVWGKNKGRDNLSGQMQASIVDNFIRII